MKRKSKAVRFFALMTALLTLCAGGASGGGARNELNLQCTVNPSILLPAHTPTVNEMAIAVNIFDNLVEANKGDFSDIIPALAESWEMSEDGLEYTFYLRRGVKFHNGSDFTAKDVLRTFQLVKDYPATSTKVFMFESWEAPDDYTVKLKLNQPFAYLLGLLASAFFGVVNADLVEAHGDLEAAIVGTGAYKLEKWNPGEIIVLTAYEDYWRGAPAIKTVNLKILTNNNTAFVAFKSGELDQYMFGGALDLESLRNNPDVSVFPVNRVGNDMLWMNCTRAPLDNLLVRRALNHAIDGEGMNMAVYDGLAQTSQLPLPEGHDGWLPMGEYTYYEYNPEKSKKLLEQAGYAPGEIKLSLIYPTTTVGTKWATACHAYLTEIGIGLQMEGLENAAWANRRLEFDFDLTYAIYSTTPYNPVNTYSAIFESNGSRSFNQFKDNPEADAIDAVIREAYKQSDPAAAKACYEEAMRMMRDQALGVPCYITQNNVMNHAGLQGVNFDNTILGMKFYHLYWKD